MKITIFGFAGSGTSTIGKLLAEKTGYEFMSSGNIMRSWAAEHGMTIYEFEDTVVKNDDEFDLKLDKKVGEYGNENTEFIFESRLAWHFIPDSFKIYLHCDNGERYRRIHEREQQPYEVIAAKNEKRESELVERYNKVYPDITFPPQKEDFDLFIDASNISPDAIIEIIIKKIT